MLLAVEPGDVKKKKRKKGLLTRTDGWCAWGPVACGGRCGVFVAVDADGWMVVVLAVEPGNVKKKEKKKKKSFTYADGWRSTRVGGGRLGAR